MESSRNEGRDPLPKDEEMNKLEEGEHEERGGRRGQSHVRGLGKSKSSHLFPGVSDVSSPHTTNRGPSRVEGSR